MTGQQAQEFIVNNKDAFEELGRLMNGVDTVQGVNTVVDFKARQLAINIIRTWLMKVWNIAYEDITVDEEDDIIRTVTHKDAN